MTIRRLKTARLYYVTLTTTYGTTTGEPCKVSPDAHLLFKL